MKKIITLLVLMAGLLTGVHAQTWEDNYTNNFTNCVNPPLYYSTGVFSKNYTAIQGSCTIWVTGTEDYGINHPLQKTYVFSIVKVDANGSETVVGTISKSNLILNYPSDFTAFIPIMTSGQHRIKLSVKIHNQWDTQVDPAYQAKLNDNVIKNVANIEADSASRNFSLGIGTIDCFNFFKCVAANLSIPKLHFIGQPTKVTATPSVAGTYTYNWAIQVISADPANGCVVGTQTFPPTIQNFIYVPCSPCEIRVRCSILGDNVNCKDTQYINIGRRPCDTTVGGGGTGTGNGKMAATVAIKSIPGKLLTIENLPAKTQHTVKLMDYNGNQRKMWNIDQPTARLFVNNAEAGKLYVVIIESKGQVIARKHIVLQ